MCQCATIQFLVCGSEINFCTKTIINTVVNSLRYFNTRTFVSVIPIVYTNIHMTTK